jgi:large subunit ribosomal protein L21
MYAIIRTGGRQFRAEVGQTLDVERLPALQIGDSFTIEDVLLIGDGDKTVIGQPLVEGAAVKVTVTDQFRGDKVIVFKYRQRTSYRRMRGHRQYHTRLKIEDIIVK